MVQPAVTLLESVLEANHRFTRPGAFPPLPKSPTRQLAIFTCMDTRLVDFLEPAMGLKRGDAKVIKNAGNTIIDPNGGVIRSLVVGVFFLGVEEIFVIGHRDCGMSDVNDAMLRHRMIERGIEADAIDALIPDMHSWLGAFTHPVENIKHVVKIIRDCSLIPDDIPVHGLLFCPDDGHLDLIENGYNRQTVSNEVNQKY